jgi:hypothetical protein
LVFSFFFEIDNPWFVCRLYCFLGLIAQNSTQKKNRLQSVLGFRLFASSPVSHLRESREGFCFCIRAFEFTLVGICLKWFLILMILIFVLGGDEHWFFPFFWFMKFVSTVIRIISFAALVYTFDRGNFYRLSYLFFAFGCYYSYRYGVD